MNAANNDTFWQNAYQQHAPKLLGLCRRYVAEPNMAQDLMHDSFLTAINKYDTYKHAGSFEGWLSRIAVNTVLMYLRKQKKWIQSIDNVEISDISEVEIEEPDNPKSLILGSDFGKEALLAAIDELPLHHKAVFNLYVFEQYSHQQIAETLQISVGTSKSHLARGRKKLQTILLQKALEMKHKDRKSAFMPFWVSNDDFIDKLFKKELGNLDLQPENIPPALNELLRSAVPKPVATPIAKPWLHFFKTKFVFTLFSLLGIFSTIYLFRADTSNQYISKNIDKQNINKKEITIAASTIETPKVVSILPNGAPRNPKKTVQERVSEKQKTLVEDSDLVTAIPEKQTIVLKKQIIKKDTILK